MARRIYLLRHGRPRAEDERRRYIGVTDIPLSERGRREAEISATWLRENASSIGRVYSSPLQRAWETAMIVARAANLPEPLPAPELREIDLGEWENRPMDEIRETERALFDGRGAHPWDFRTSGGETFREAAKRFSNFLIWIRKSLCHASDGDVLLVSHAGVMRAFLCGLMSLPGDELFSLRMPMASLSVLEEQDGGLRVLKYGFLPEESLTDEKIEELYKKYQTPPRVIRHMRAVASFAGEILDALNGGFHRDRIVRSALLHDILRFEKGHARRGAEALRGEGYDEIAALAGAHNDGDFDPDAPLDDADILWYADKRVLEDRRVSIEERFSASRDKCSSPEARQQHERRWNKALDIQNKLKKRGVTL